MLRPDQLAPSSTSWTGPRAWIDRVNTALSASRWVTVVGPIGSGKTRLAQEAVAAGGKHAVHIRLDAGETGRLLEAKMDKLRANEHPLLVVDSADRAPEAVARLLPRWLGVHQTRRVLVTSRIRLGPAGDTTLWMPPFEADVACEMFERFVHEAGATFDFSAHRVALARALRDLGEAPLAILGLAQRALVLDPPDLFASVSEVVGRLELRTPLGTLRDAAAEAWNALPRHARASVAALAVFAEPATPRDIETVSELRTDALEFLVSHSAIRPRIVSDQRRLEVVPVLRDFARESAPDEAAACRHRAFFLQLASEHPSAPPWRELAAAADAAGAPEDALALWVAAAPGIQYDGSARLVLTALERLWPENPTPAHRLAFGTVARIAGESARSLVELTVGYDDATDPGLKAELGCALATVQRHTNDTQRARATFERVIHSAHTPDGPRALAWERLGGLELEQGFIELAEQHYARAEDAFHRITDVAGVARVRHARGLIAQERGDFQTAELAFTVALRDHQAARADRFAAIALFDLGALLLERGRVGAARRQLEQAMHSLQHAGDRRQVGLTHALLGVCATEDGDLARAWSELRRARDAIDPRDPQAAETLGLYEAFLAGSPARIPTVWSDEARYAQRLIDASQHRARTRVTLCEDGSFIDHPTRGRAEVRSDAARGILAALVEAFEGGSMSTVGRDALIHAGWPDRVRVDGASRNRLNVELSRLRKAGLHEQLARGEGGYRLKGPLRVTPRPTSD